MSVAGRFESPRFPYLAIDLTVNGTTVSLDALLDTGFDGHLAIPPQLNTFGRDPDLEIEFFLADGSLVEAQAYRGVLRVDGFDPGPATIVVLGNEPTVGRRVTDLYTVILDHGRRVIVEP